MFFVFQAEDGIRGHCVTGVQTCALPIWAERFGVADRQAHDIGVARAGDAEVARVDRERDAQIGRASCRERV